MLKESRLDCNRRQAKRESILKYNFLSSVNKRNVTNDRQSFREFINIMKRRGLR